MANEKSLWCSHIYWRMNQWMMDVELSFAKTTSFVPDNWSVCPVKGCNAIRPEEPKELWDFIIQGYFGSGSSGHGCTKIIKSMSQLALEWFGENFPESVTIPITSECGDAVTVYKHEIYKWINQEKEKCR